MPSPTPRGAERHKRSKRPSGQLKTEKTGTWSRMMRYLDNALSDTGSRFVSGKGPSAPLRSAQGKLRALGRKGVAKSKVNHRHHRPHSAHHHHHHVSWVSAVLAAGLFGLLPFDMMHMNLLVAEASNPGYVGTVSQTALSVDMKPGEQKTVILTYTNTGTKTWYRTGVKDYVSLYLVGKTSSPVGGPAWRANDSPALITDSTVKPGAKTTVKFTIYGHAAGTYSETLRLAAEDTAWMKTAETKLTVHVSGTPVASTPSAPAPSMPTQPISSAPLTSGRSAMLLLRSTNLLTLGGGQRAQVTLGFKNTGTTIWTSRSLALAGMYPALTGDPNTQVYDDTWVNRGVPVHQDTVTNPGEIGFLNFWIKAPARKGDYRISLALQADDQSVAGGMVDIPITVTADGNIVNSDPIPVPPTIPTSGVTPPVVVGSDGIPQSPDFKATEPIIRIGIFATTDDQTVLTAHGPFRVQQKGSTVCAFSADQQVTIRFDRTYKVYKATGPGCQTQSSEPYQVQRTDDPLGPLIMADFSRPVSWLPGANDNSFRSIIELRWSSSTDAVWVINELPMEMYLRGIGETSDISPMEYQKALLTAARTYAFYLWSHGTKHANEGFDVDAKYDQVYRGYGSEARSPHIVQAVDSTRGQIVTYNGKYAITPYFSRSDGRTRTWKDVWGGTGYPWCIGVSVPWDQGKTLWGHGVGMSATGALGMANDGKLYREILPYFYTGTSLMRFY